MKISIGCDHSALDLKNVLIKYLEQKGHEIVDRGTYTYDSCDYTDFGLAVAKDIESKTVDCGIVICFTGIGMSIIANKVKGVRCALCTNTELAKMTRLHNNSNMLALGASVVSEELAMEIVDTFLDTEFSNEERHIRRIDLIEK